MSGTWNKVRRMPAEWEGAEAIIMAYPDSCSDWNYILDEARDQFDYIIITLLSYCERVILICSDKKYTVEHLTGNGLTKKLSSELILVEQDLNDTWTRDYGPISVIEQAESIESILNLDFGFNAWGLKFAADKDNTAVRKLRDKGILKKDSYRNYLDFILEGGALESDGKGTLLTTEQCLLSPNRNPAYTVDDIENILKTRLGLKRILWLKHGHIIGDDTDSHIDTICRFAPNDTIVYTSAGSNSQDPQYEDLDKMYEDLKQFRTLSGVPYNLVALPLPDPIFEDGRRLAAGYANYLVTDRCLYLPTYSQPYNDNAAEMVLKSVYPDHTIIPIDCRTLIKQGGSLHCSTMQVYPGALNMKN